MSDAKTGLRIEAASISIGTIVQGDHNTVFSGASQKAGLLTREGAFVFVSHASPDKQRLRPHLERLMDRGVSLWIDRPDECGFGERYRAGNRISYGSDWKHEIALALDAAALVLVFWSRHTFQEARDEFWREVRAGFDTGRLVQAMLDRDGFEGRPLLSCLDPRLTWYQIADLTAAPDAAYADHKIANLAEDLCGRLTNAGHSKT